MRPARPRLGDSYSFRNRTFLNFTVPAPYWSAIGPFACLVSFTSTIFIPLSFIAGVYGMNFAPETSPWNMPELRWRWGYPMALAIMGGVAFGLVLWFRRRGWLRGDEEGARRAPGYSGPQATPATPPPASRQP